jgi:hypothetical protein
MFLGSSLVSFVRDWRDYRDYRDCRMDGFLFLRVSFVSFVLSAVAYSVFGHAD